MKALQIAPFPNKFSFYNASPLPSGCHTQRYHGSQSENLQRKVSKKFSLRMIHYSVSDKDTLGKRKSECCYQDVEPNTFLLLVRMIRETRES